MNAPFRTTPSTLNNWPDWLPPWEKLRADQLARFERWLAYRPEWWSPQSYLHDELRDPRSWPVEIIPLTTGQIDGGGCAYVTRFAWQRLSAALPSPAPTIRAADDRKGHVYAKLYHPELERRAGIAGVPPNSIWLAPTMLTAFNRTDYDARSRWLPGAGRSDCNLLSLDLMHMPTYIDPHTGEVRPAKRSEGTQRVISELLREYDVRRYGVSSEDGE